MLQAMGRKIEQNASNMCIPCPKPYRFPAQKQHGNTKKPYHFCLHLIVRASRLSNTTCATFTSRKHEGIASTSFESFCFSTLFSNAWFCPPPGKTVTLRGAPGHKGAWRLFFRRPAPHVHAAGHLYPGGPRRKRPSPRQTAAGARRASGVGKQRTPVGAGPAEVGLGPAPPVRTRQTKAGLQRRAKQTTERPEQQQRPPGAGPSKEADEACSLLAPAATDLEREDGQRATVGQFGSRSSTWSTTNFRDLEPEIALFF